MKLVYLAGPFRGANSWEIECNIRRAEALALKVWQAGAACICPHANTRFYQGIVPDTIWLDGDMEIMKRCDAVLTTHNWQQSHGAIKEVYAAVEAHLPIFHAEWYGEDGEEEWFPLAFKNWLESAT